MSTPFGTPGFGAPQTTTGTTQATNGVEQPSDAPQELIDPNDPRLTSESVEMNLAGDAFAQPAPPPDAKYRAKLKLEGVKNDKGEVSDYGVTQTKRGAIVPYYQTGVSATIIDPSGKYDGITVYPPFGGMLGTLQGRDGSSKVSTVLARLKRPDGKPWAEPGRKMTQRDWIDLFVKALKGEPEIGIETQWQWSCQSCGEIAKKTGGDYPKGLEGMHHFPQEQDAARRKAHGHNYSHEVQCPIKPGEHGYTRGRAVIARFLALEELGK